jgi:hypothetical protein
MKKAKLTAPLPAQPVTVHCAHDELVEISLLKPHPRNPNRHPARQIELLAKIIKHQGWRAPIVVSKRSGLIVAGHGRLEAARQLGLEHAPVNHQDFASEADELAHLVADNRISEFSETDNELLKKLFTEMGGFDMELLAFEQREIEARLALTGDNPFEEWRGMPEFNQLDKRAFRSIIMHFPNQGEVDKFAGLIGASVTEKTKYLWFPKIEIEPAADKRWAGTTAK